MSFYGDLVGGGQGVFFLRDGRLQTVADTYGPYTSIGPFGPTMDEAGMVAFRADRAVGVRGIFAGDPSAVVAVADTGGPWRRFHGLRVITGDGTVVFRADRKDGTEGIYAGRAGSIRSIAETGDLFESLGRFPSANGHEAVAFAATLRAGGAGIFTAEEGRINRISETDDAFEAYRGALITNAGAVMRIATPRGGTLGSLPARIQRRTDILAAGDPLLGSTVSEFGSNLSVNAAGQVAISATLTDGRQIILRADPSV
jgi:hypothetical protein